MRRGVLALIGLMVIIVLAFLAFTSLDMGRKTSEEITTTRYAKVTIGLLRVDDSLPFIIADIEGLYSKYGLDVKLEYYGAARDRDAAFMSGLIDVALSDPITTLTLADKGVDVKIISLLLGEDPRDGVFYLLAPPNSTIGISDVKQIAISKNTIIEFVAWVMLERLGLDPKGIEFVDVPSIPLRYQMLMEGKIQAAALPDPWASLAIVEGARVLARDDMFGEPITISVIAANSKIAGDKTLVENLVKALNEALNLYKSNPEKYRSVIEERIFIPERLRGQWLPQWHGKITAYPENHFDLVAKWLYERGLIKAMPDYERLVVRIS